MLCIEDVTDFVREQATHAERPYTELMTPVEDVYPVSDAIAARIGVTR